MTVYVLIVYMAALGTSSNTGGPLVIDNIASAEECRKLKTMFDNQPPSGLTGQMRPMFISSVCVPVRKVKS